MSSLGSLRNSVGLGRLSLCLAELDMEEREVENSRWTFSHEHDLIFIPIWGLFHFTFTSPSFHSLKHPPSTHDKILSLNAAMPKGRMALPNQMNFRKKFKPSLTLPLIFRELWFRETSKTSPFIKIQNMQRNFLNWKRPFPPPTPFRTFPKIYPICCYHPSQIVANQHLPILQEEQWICGQ